MSDNNSVLKDRGMDVAVQEVIQKQLEVKKTKTKTYVHSEIPVRTCTADCPRRNTCKDYINGRVEDQDLCKPELRQIKKWQVAFRKGDLDSLKDDVGTVAGGMAVQVVRLLEAVNNDGAVIEQPVVNKAGDIEYEKVTHPALMAASKIMKDLGLDMNGFLMTPKAAQDKPPQVQVNIGISADEVHNRFASRFGKKEEGDE